MVQHRASGDPVLVADIEKEIVRVQSLSLEDVRSLWQTTFKNGVPKALSRDLLVRMLAWHIQEQAFGGHDRAMLKILASYAKSTPDTPRARRLKAGASSRPPTMTGEYPVHPWTAQPFRRSSQKSKPARSTS
jgi:hypothetical protein